MLREVSWQGRSSTGIHPLVVIAGYPTLPLDLLLGMWESILKVCASDSWGKSRQEMR